MKKIGSLFIGISLLSAAPITLAEDWEFGVGTGLFALNVKGDIGIGTTLGPSKSELDLDFDDVSNFMESAFGIVGFAKKNQWKINYAITHLELAGHADVNSSSVELTFTTNGFDINGEYIFAGTGLSAYSGIRSTEHEIDFNVDGAVNFDRNIKEDWVDAYIGAAYTLAIAKNITWSTRADIGGGGSESSMTVNTGVTWLFLPSWATTFYGKYYSVDYENGSESDSDWYLYDNDEFGVGLGIVYLW